MLKCSMIRLIKMVQKKNNTVRIIKPIKAKTSLAPLMLCSFSVYLGIIYFGIRICEDMDIKMEQMEEYCPENI